MGFSSGVSSGVLGFWCASRMPRVLSAHSFAGVEGSAVDSIVGTRFVGVDIVVDRREFRQGLAFYTVRWSG